MENTKRGKKEYIGTVKSVGMTGTVKVSVSTPERHPKYQKIVRYSKVYLTHSDIEVAVGDEVTIRESKPYSKNVKSIVVKKNGTEGK